VTGGGGGGRLLAFASDAAFGYSGNGKSWQKATDNRNTPQVLLLSVIQSSWPCYQLQWHFFYYTRDAQARRPFLAFIHLLPFFTAFYCIARQ
jgi:hypothetical protein